MFPKVELVPMSTYLVTLAKLRRPSSTPSYRTRRLRRDADVGRVQRGRVVDPVAEVADHVAAPLQRQDDPVLLLRRHPSEDRALLG
jgi:hypothetical protein